MRGKKLPVYIIHDDGVNENQMNAVKEGVMELLQIARIESEIEVCDFGVWRDPNWKVKGELLPFGSIDWYLKQGRIAGRNQLHAADILGAIQREPWQDAVPHYDVMVTSKDLFLTGTSFVLGAARPGLGTVLSVVRWESFSAGDQFELIKTETEHEFGHVLGLPNGNRADLNQDLGRHCCNKCVMQQGMTVPNDWIEITNDRLTSDFGPLCPTCKRDLQNHFN